MAIAAAISLRSYLHITTLSERDRAVTLNFVDIGLVHSWNIDHLPWERFYQYKKGSAYGNAPMQLDKDLLDALGPHLDAVVGQNCEEAHKMHRSSALAFLYLFLSLGSPQVSGLVYTLRSTIPIGAGLGSSASISVCFATAMLLQFYALSGPHPKQTFDESATQLERINRWAFVSEICIHGNPSGVDNTVSTYGKAVIFRRSNYNQPPSIRPLWNFPEMPFLLIDTKQKRSTAHEVAKVSKLKIAYPELVDSILAAMNHVTATAASILEGHEFIKQTHGSLQRFGELMNINHGLLTSLGVSHPRLERVRELVNQEGVGWTKLTGAGGGGCSITLMRHDICDDKLQKLYTALELENYTRFKTTLGGDGVGVLWPAEVKNITNQADIQTVAIDADNFLSAQGSEGIEKLLGIDRDLGERRGWRFWKLDSQ